MLVIKTAEEIKYMRESCKIASLIISELLNNFVRPGITTLDIDVRASLLCMKHKVRPAFLNYNGFPGCICTCINEEVVHCVPSPNKVLREGDLLSLDFGVEYKDYCSDMARTVIVEDNVSNETSLKKRGKKGIKAVRSCYEEAIKIIKAGIWSSDISFTVQKTAREKGFYVVKEFCSHGVGRVIHEPPQIFNFGMPGRGVELLAGVTIALEPIIREDKGTYVLDQDGWTTRTDTKCLSFHHENTILITEDGVEELTHD